MTLFCLPISRSKRPRLEARKVRSSGKVVVPVSASRRQSTADTVAPSTCVDEESQSKNDPALIDQLNSIEADSLEVLLAMETQVRVEFNQGLDRPPTQSSMPSLPHPRPQPQPRNSRLKFELPTAPSRLSSPPVKLESRQWSLPVPGVRSDDPLRQSRRWLPRLRGSISTTAEAASGTRRFSTARAPQVGDRVQLIRRPLPTFGSIRYIGQVDFAPGEWIGVELDSRVGRNDGSMEGRRYFTTASQRGEFVTPAELALVSITV